MNRDTYGVNPLAPDAPRRPTPRDPAPPAVSYEGDPLTYDGEAGTLFGMGLKIALLTVLTLGIYRFWGKTNVRRYLWSRLRLFGDRFEYTGTGKELFLGFLIALVVLIPLGALSYAISLLLVGSSPMTQGVVTAAQYVVLLFLLGYAAFRARRYRLSRTALRGIRFWQTGSNIGYAMRWMGYFLLTAITFGIASPVGDVGLYRYTMRHTWFGSQPFEFDGRAGPMMGRWILCLLLLPFTLGLSLLWFAAFKLRYFAGQTAAGRKGLYPCG